MPAHPTSETQIPALLAEAKALARQNKRSEARALFARVLSHDPRHVEALLWLAAIEPDPKQSVRYLDRVLEISPGNPRAVAGLHWAAKRLSADPQSASRPLSGSVPLPAELPVMDSLLLGTIVLVCFASCILLALMAWDAPGAVRAAYLPTPTYTVTATPTATAEPTHTLVPTTTATPTHTWTPTATSDPPTPTPTATLVVGTEPPHTTALGMKRIELDLSDQRLTAYEGDTEVLTALVSTGIARYPTPLGDYKIIRKVRAQVMSGPGYYLPNVEWVSYFVGGYAIHGTYWHTNFGHPMSHGCVNMTNDDAKWIFNWAPMGTPVTVRR
jgi:lipoprotein-anchoring transpeptidase ErfK/SrfK